MKLSITACDCHFQLTCELTMHSVQSACLPIYHHRVLIKVEQSTLLNILQKGVLFQ